MNVVLLCTSQNVFKVLPSKKVKIHSTLSKTLRSVTAMIGLLRYSKCKSCRHTHTQHFYPATFNQVIACWCATMSAGMCVMNAAKAFKVSTLPLCQLGYLFNQRVTWMQAECDGGGRYRDYTLFNPAVSRFRKDIPFVMESDSPCKAFLTTFYHPRR